MNESVESGKLGSSSRLPLLSVITVHLDDFEALGRTMESLKGRDAALEWIVVDGGSHPQEPSGSLLLQGARDRADRFLEGPDSGIYDAMNKGTAVARGRYVLYLNAGDQLHPEFNPQDLDTLIDGSLPDMIWGQCYDLDVQGRCYPRKTRRARWLKLGMPVSHQAVLFNRGTLGPHPYRSALRFAGDYELLCRLFSEGGRILRSNIPVCIFDLMGRSAKNKKASLAEEATVRAEYFPDSLLSNPLVSWTKLLGWKLSGQIPGLRRAWRRWI